MRIQAVIMGILTPEVIPIAHKRLDPPEPNRRSPLTSLAIEPHQTWLLRESADTLNKLPSGEEEGDESSAVPHGSVGEEDEDNSPNDESKSEDSDSRSVGNSLTFGSGCPTTGAGVATVSVLVSKPVTVLVTVPGGSTA